MALFNSNDKLRQAFRAQRALLFGKKRYLFHLALWLVALVYLAFGVFGDFSKGFKKGMKQSGGITVNGIPFTETPYVIISVLSALVAAVMVYFFLLYVVPYARHRRQRRYLWLGIMLNGCLWLILFMSAILFLGMKYNLKENLDEHDLVFILMLSMFFAGITAGLFFSLYYFIDLYDHQKSLNHYRVVLTEKLEAETNFLKTQINPHFLFNTLNNIYSLTLSRPEDAAVISRQLKDLITYMLQECSMEKVPLSGEFDFLKNYINLEQLRNRQEQADISLTIKGDIEGKSIAPLLLINFIENAFKHGVKAGIEHVFVRISLLVMDNRLAMEITNSKPASGADTSKAVKEYGGIGIRNVKRRLAILYPHRHKLRISESKEEYSVYLMINL